MDDSGIYRPRSGSGNSFFPGKDDLIEIPSDDFPPISTFHVSSPSPRKTLFQQPPRQNRLRYVYF